MIRFWGGKQSLDGLVICMTGTCERKRAAVIKLIKAGGGSISKTVTKKTTHLLLAPGGEGTSKHTAAIKKNLPIISEADVVALSNE